MRSRCLQAVPTAKGQALADEYGIRFFETVSKSFICLDFAMQLCLHVLMMKTTFVFQSAKTNLNVEQVFFSIATDIKQRLADTDTRAEVFSTEHFL